VLLITSQFIIDILIPRLDDMLDELMSERKSLAVWWNAPALNPKMRRGLSVLPVRWKREEHKKQTRI
jgi:hypothetical protein